MPDNSSPFDFDDDNLDWLNADLGADEDAGTPPPPAAPTGDTTTPPWRVFQGPDAPSPSRAGSGPTPWQTFQGSDAPPPAAPMARPPWGESAPPPPSLPQVRPVWDETAPEAGAEDLDDLGGLTWLSEDALDHEAGGDAGLGDRDALGAFDWDSADRAPTAPGASEKHTGLTDFLPWRQEAAARDADEGDLSLDDDLFAVDTPDEDDLNLDDDLFAVDADEDDLSLDDDLFAVDADEDDLSLDDDLFAVDADEDELNLEDDLFAVDADEDELSLDDDLFAVDTPGEAPRTDQSRFSLRDRLLAASPSSASESSTADLGGLFDDEEPDEAASSHVADLGDLFGDEEPDEAAFSHAADLGGLFGDEESDETAFNRVADLGSLFDDEESDETAFNRVADLGSLFDDEEPGEVASGSKPEDFGALFADEFDAFEADTPEAVADTHDDAWIDEAFEQVNAQTSLEDASEPAASNDLGMEFVFEDDNDAEEAESLPDWLQGDVEFPEEEAAESEPVPEPAPRGIRRITPVEPLAEESDDTADDMASWLDNSDWDEPTGDNELSDLTYEEWERINREREEEEQRTDEDRLLDSVPDMFLPTGDQPSTPATPPPADAEPAAGFVPGWFLGLDDTPQEDMPDWLKQSDFSSDMLSAPISEPAEVPPAAPVASSGDVPDWFQAPELPDVGADWATAFGAPPAAPEPIIEPPSDEEAELNWMSAPDATPEESEHLPLPKTGALFGLETPIPQPEIDSPPPGTGDDWLDEASLEAVQNQLDEQILPKTGQLFGDRLSPETQAALDALDANQPTIPGLDLEAGLPLPATGDLNWDDLDDSFSEDEGEPALEAGEVPDWLAQAAPDDARVAPADIPFPDLDLDQTMPGDTALDDLRAAALDTDDDVDAQSLDDDLRAAALSADDAEESDDWMREFAPSGSDAAFFAPRQPTGPLDDFVERFDPGTAAAAAAANARAEAEAALQDEAPDWLRELGEEGSLLEVPDDVNLADSAQEGGKAGGLLGDESDMDWLSSIDEAAAALGDESLIPFDRALTSQDSDRRPVPVDEEPAEEPAMPFEDPERGIIHTAPLDSRALDRLLGLDKVDDEIEIEDTLGIDPAHAPVVPPVSALARLRTDQDSSALDDSLDDLSALIEGAETGSAAQLAALFDEHEAPDLTALFDESGTPSAGEAAPLGLFPGEGAPAADKGKAPAEAKQRRRGLFRRRRKQKETDAAPAAPKPGEVFEDIIVEAAIEVDDRPMWIDEMRPSDVPMVVKAGGAETSVRQKQVIELPDRLRVFYERSQRELEFPGPMPAADRGPLAGIAGALPPTLLMQPSATTRPVEGLIITPEQQKRIDRLQALLEQVAAEDEAFEEERAELAVAETFTLSEFQDGEEGETGTKAATPRATPRPRRPRRTKVDRVVVMLIMLAALVVPFFTDVFHFASSPPPLGQDQQIVADAVDLLATSGDYVLFAFEYGPTAAGELDPLAQAVLRDVLTQGAIPLTISTDPAGALHAAAVIEPLIEDKALLAARDKHERKLVEGQDYVLLRYLTGEAVGVRSLATVYTDADDLVQQHPAFKTDLRGDDTNLSIGNLTQDIALIVVIGEESSAIRTWAEQLHSVPVIKLALVTTAIEPLTIPYVMENETDIGYAGYLAGMRDTYSYNAARNTANRTPYVVPDDAPLDVPDPATSQWHSTALGAAVAALLITFGMIMNLFRGLRRRRR